MRRLGLFALIFIVLAALYILLERPRTQHALPEQQDVLPEFASAQISRLIITCPQGGTIELQRSAEHWSVSQPDSDDTYTADVTAAQDLLDTLRSLASVSMVSRNPDRHALYEVCPESALRVKALDNIGRTLAQLMIGKTGPNIFSTYVRSADSDAVYLIDGILRTKAAKSLNEWRDKKIFDFDPALVSTYRVSGDCTLSAALQDGTWHREEHGEEPVDSAAITRAVRTLARLSAADFAEGTFADFGLDAPALTISSGKTDGMHSQLLVGDDANAFQQYAASADADTVYIVEKYLLDVLCPAPEQLKAPEVAADPSD